MLAIKASRPVSIKFSFEKAFHSLEKQITESKRAPHADGWGFGFYKIMDDTKQLQVIKGAGKEAQQPFHEYFSEIEQVLPEIESDIIISHVRKASNPPTNQRNAQPFGLGKYVFAQNGSIKQPEKIIELLDDEVKSRPPPLPEQYNDSEIYFRLILQEFKESGSIIKAIQEAVTIIKERSNYSGLNFFLSDGAKLYVYCDAKDITANEQYYQLYFTKRKVGSDDTFSHVSKESCLAMDSSNFPDDVVLIASEQITANGCEPWFSLKKEHLMIVDEDMQMTIKRLMEF